MKTGNKKNNKSGVRDTVMGILAKNGVKNVVQVGASSNLRLELVGDPTPPTGGNRELNDLLKKIRDLTAPSSVVDPLPKNGGKRKKGSSAARFYWQYSNQDDLPVPIFVITPKDLFDAEGCLSDEHFDEEGIPEGFVNVMESTFEFDGTRQQAEALLRANPLFEEKEMV